MLGILKSYLEKMFSQQHALKGLYLSNQKKKNLSG